MRAQFSEYQLYLRCDFYKESSYTNGKCCLLGGYGCCPMVQAVPLMAFADPEGFESDVRAEHAYELHCQRF